MSPISANNSSLPGNRKARAWRARLAGRIGVTLSVTLVATLLPAEAWAASPGNRSGVDLPGLQQDIKAKLDKVAAAKLQGWDGAAAAPPPGYEPSRVTPPAAGSEPVALNPESGAQLVQAGGLPISIGKASPTERNPTPPAPSGTWVVAVEARTATESAGVDGAIIKVTPPAGSSTPVDVQLDYKKFEDLYGTEWATRLELKQLPECFLTTPERPECSAAVDVPSTNDPHAGTVRATVDPVAVPGQGLRTMSGGGGAMVLAASDGGSGAGGTYKATPLSPSGSWSAGGSGGGFSWTYPLTVPPNPAGPEPKIAFSYSSQAVDGKTSVANGQGSWIGDGWSYEPGYIERRYRACSEDRDATGGAPNNDNSTDKKKGDLCWAGDNLVMSLGGSTTELVRDAASGQLVPAADDGSKIERMSGSANGAKDGEYWVVTTRDGTRYHFGRHNVGTHGDGASPLTVTDSVFTVPVFGNHPGEPCHQAAYANSSCRQAWRWNLDYVEDVHGNAMVIDWQPEQNRYAKNAKFKEKNAAEVGYTRGGYPTRILYGLRADNLAGAPAGRVEFTLAERCIEEGGVKCGNAQFDSKNYGDKQPWWDTPSTLHCKMDAENCHVASPTFWSRKRLTGVTTYGQRTEGSTALSKVDHWSLTQSFPKQRTDTHPPLWLESITRTGYGTAKDSGDNLIGIPLPPVSFLANVQDMPNRVAKSAGDATPDYDRLRVETIRNETGGETYVDYSAPCAVGTTHPKPEANTTRCFPVHWSPDTELEKPPLEWFNKYVVEKVVEKDRVARQPDVTTSYTYEGDAAWGKDTDEFTKPELRTYSQWRGYASVVTTKGVTANAGKPDATEQSQTRTRYFRGMSGDGGRAKVRVKDSTNAEDLGEDLLQLQGQVAETISYTKAGGNVSSRVINWPWSQRTANRPRRGTTDLEAFRTGTARSDAFQSIEGGTRMVRTQNTFDEGAYGLPKTAQAEVLTSNGTGWTSSEQNCITTTYVHNTTKHIIGLAQRVRSTAGDCSKAATGQVLTDTRTSYDALNAFGTAPVKGLPVQVDTLDGAGTGWVTTARTEYDALGRPIKAYDAAGNPTSTTVSPPTGPVFSTTITNALGHTVTAKSDPGRGSVLESTDANGRKASMAYDALGRTTGVWTPSRKQGTDKAAFVFSYDISVDMPPTVVSGALRDNGTYENTVTVYDGLLRTRQTQKEALGGGRLITDTLYNASGAVRQTDNAYYAEGEPDKKIFVPETVFHVPNATATAYDGLGRAVRSTTLHEGTPHHSAVVTYGGNWTVQRSAMSADGTAPLPGSEATRTWTDALNRTTLVQKFAAADLTTWTDTKYAYDVRGKLAKVTDAAGNDWTYSYDARGRLIGTSDPDLGISSFGYNNLDQQVWSENAAGQKTFTNYDKLNRKTAEVEDAPNGTPVATWSYDTLPGAKGQPVASTRRTGDVTVTSKVTGYDSEYRPTGTTLTIPDGAATKGLAGTYAYTTTYTSTGKVQSTTVPATPGGLAAEKLITRYNEEGAPTTMSGLSWYTAETVFSPFGEVLRTASGKAPHRVWTTSFYDPTTGRVTDTSADRETTGPNRINARSYKYDTSGKITSVTDRQSGGRVDRQCYTYNTLGQLTKAWTGKTENCTGPSLSDVTPGPDGDGYWQEYEFDAIGNRTKLINRDLTNAALDDTTTYAYGVQVTGNGGLPPVKTHPHALTEAKQTTKSQNSTVTSLSTYGYDSAGNTTRRTIDGDTQILNWDRRNKLASASSPGIGAVTVTGLAGKCLDVDGGNSADGTPAQVMSCNESKAQKWTLGGDTVKALGKCLTAKDSRARLYTCDGSNEQKFTSRPDKTLYNQATGQCVTVPNDDAADGNDLHIYTCVAGSAAQQWVFGGSGSSYIYDASGNRLIQETGSSRTLYLGEAEVTVNLAGQAVDAVRYYTGVGATTTVRQTKGKTTGHALTVLLSDRQGTATTMVEQAAGQKVTHRKADPYGNPRGAQVGNWAGQRDFLGTGTDDSATRLTHIGAREYEPANGRFISVDPVIDITNPMQMNGYVYANGDPVNQMDPTGLESCFPNYCAGTNGTYGDYKEENDPEVERQRVSGGVGSKGSAKGDAKSGTKSTVKLVLAGKTLPTEEELLKQGYWPTRTYQENLRRWANGYCSSTGARDRQDFCDTANRIKLTSPSGDWMEALGIRSTWECIKDPGWNKNCGMAAVDVTITIAGSVIGRAAKAATAGRAVTGAVVHDAVDVAIACLRHNSFTEDTLVLMADGTTKEIDDVEVGEKVLATDPVTGETTPKTVTAEILTKDDKEYVDLTIGAGEAEPVITTTAHHLFWSMSADAWVEAGDLKAGMTLRTDDGRGVSIARTRSYRADQATYNLTVSDLHTYYVLAESTPVLVHNENGWQVPDDFVIVRGGERPMPGAGEGFSGAMGTSVAEAGAGVPHGKLRATTAGEIRAAGGTVDYAPEPIRGEGSPLNYNHVNVTLGSGDPFGELESNPVPKTSRLAPDALGIPRC
ncbi:MULTISPECIES: ricin-type beta-trefoil lectin domain protein [unclassified Streptomyces]|uniref:ricin-type beta-trefoil lectin domain protein n=1 Tax=unclassified Streptomyces TaxID=2593676 RepID=UPI002E2A1363|nr:ricin-type beta-trefoil lectin domain protein [Streptomyces sp. NBC_00273]